MAYRFSSVSCIYYGSSPDGSYSEAPGGMFSSNGCDALFDVCACKNLLLIVNELYVCLFHVQHAWVSLLLI